MTTTPSFSFPSDYKYPQGDIPQWSQWNLSGTYMYIISNSSSSASCLVKPRRNARCALFRSYVVRCVQVWACTSNLQPKPTLIGGTVVHCLSGQLNLGEWLSSKNYALRSRVGCRIFSFTVSTCAQAKNTPNSMSKEFLFYENSIMFILCAPCQITSLDTNGMIGWIFERVR